MKITGRLFGSLFTVAACVAASLVSGAGADASVLGAEEMPHLDSRDPNGDLRVGNPMAMRGGAADAMLEQIAAIEYRQLIADATVQRRLLPQTDSRVRRVQAVVDSLMPYALKWNDRSRNWNWEVNLVRAPRLDAYCMPGGKVVVFTGLLERLRPSDDEIAMLIGHEIAHALRQHARVMIDDRMLRQYRGTPSAPQLFGITDFDFDTGVGFPDVRYSADDEREADVIGTEIAARAGYDPRAALAFWQRVAALDRRMPVELAAEHPVTAGRLDDLRRRQVDMLALYAKAVHLSVNALPAYGKRSN
ncbi:M48 family metallopeptidase [Pararobbsia alpina]|uniref:Beta-barrel assembly-enhancing protease n=1 Tax=Pararobbsia alpina TaxID=621374 RepID=A0A6S7C1R8_9BURK|nr:M48 family metallopeptidase [Pararobbsia alpina]CAB3779010.1 Beta-barrel assembly-enhancing protease [Pararobbsia alpina]